MSLSVIHLPKYEDERGYLSSIYKHNEHCNTIKFVEDRISISKYGVIRGMHGDQKTWKFCTCLAGALHLVTYDLQQQQKEEFLLTEENKFAVLIPPNYLNGHQCLSYKCILYYKWSEYYSGPESQISVSPFDTTINIKWSILPGILSDRDNKAQQLKDLY